MVLLTKKKNIFGYSEEQEHWAGGKKMHRGTHGPVKGRDQDTMGLRKARKRKAGQEERGSPPGVCCPKNGEPCHLQVFPEQTTPKCPLQGPTNQGKQVFRQKNRSKPGSYEY